MSDDEDYEILPHKEILEIKKEIQKLKGTPVQDKSGLGSSVSQLSSSIDSLMGLFKASAEDIKMERHDEKLLLQKIEPMIDKFNTIIEQNEKIAKGIVAVADMIKTHIIDKIKEEPEEIHEDDVHFDKPEPKQSFQPQFQQYQQPNFQPQFQPNFGGPPVNPPPRRQMPVPPEQGPMPYDDFPSNSPPGMDFQPMNNDFPPNDMPMGQQGDNFPPPPPPGDFGDEPFPPPKKGFFSKFKK